MSEVEEGSGRGSTEADGPSSPADARMADLLADGVRATPDLRRRLQDEASAESDDLLARLNALDYLDSVVGDVGSDLPERLGDYRIIGLLGRGGMGTVFEAFQESLERIVALKVLAPSLTTDPRMRKRFRVEARASATLHHQFIVPVYGFGEAGGHLYFAMERVDGVSLDKHISAARHRGAPVMEAREAARRFAGVADALGHAHRRGILHRDIKPGNILVHPDGSLALADFGLSKMMGEPSLSISQHGGFLGTLHYAAPEQARGRPVTPSSDLYSLGVTIYECVTGQLPVQGETTEALLQALLNEDARPLRQLVPRAPRDLEIVLEKLLSKDPDDRYSDGDALARDLLRVADDEPVLVRRRPILVRAWRQVRKHSLLSAALALSILLLLTVFVLWRQVVGEEETARIALHAARLNEAVAMAETEPGRFDGPDGLLAVLLGVELAAGGTDTRVVAMLDEAEAARPEQPRTRELRSAYLADPVPAATEALRSGRGQVALGLLDREIEASESSGFAERDAVTWLRLYRLYLARAVARLTAAVADADGAGDDLLRAAFVRPGAFVPALLAALVDWDPARGAGPLFDQVDALLRDRPAAAGRVAAELLRAVALDDRPIGAHLLPMSIPYALRRELLRRAIGYAGGALAARGTTTTFAGRIEAELAEAAQRAAAALADAPRLREALAGGRELLTTEVAKTSPLQSWRLVFALLEGADPASVQLGEGEPLPPALQVRGIRSFVGLDIPVEVVQLTRAPLERSLAAAEAVGVRVDEARVLLLHRLGDVDGAFVAVDGWIDRAADDPAAYLARLECRIERGEFDWAAFDGAQALRLAVQPDAIRSRVVSLLDEAGRRPRDGGRWRDLARRFASAGG